MKKLLLLLLIALPLSAQTFTELPAPIAWPPLQIGQDDFTPDDLTLDGTQTDVGTVIHAYGQACRVKEIFFSLGVVTTSQSIDVTLESLDASGNPDGTADGTCTVASPAVGGNVCTLSTSYEVAAGLASAVMFGWTGTTGDVGIEYADTGVRDSFAFYNYMFTDRTTKTESGHIVLALGCDDDNDGDVVLAEGDRVVSLPWTRALIPGGATFGYDVDDATDEIGSIITVPGDHDMQPVAICGGLDISTISTVTWEWDISVLSTGASLCTSDTCTSSTLSDEDWRFPTTTKNFGCVPTDELVTMEAGTQYVVSLRPTTATANTVELVYANFGAGNDKWVAAIGGEGGASRAGKGSWVSGASACWSGGPNCDDMMPAIWLLFGYIEEAGGGGASSHGSVQ